MTSRRSSAENFSDVSGPERNCGLDSCTKSYSFKESYPRPPSACSSAAFLLDGCLMITSIDTLARRKGGRHHFRPRPPLFSLGERLTLKVEYPQEGRFCVKQQLRHYLRRILPQHLHHLQTLVIKRGGGGENEEEQVGASFKDLQPFDTAR